MMWLENCARSLLLNCFVRIGGFQPLATPWHSDAPDELSFRAQKPHGDEQGATPLGMMRASIVGARARAIVNFPLPA